MQFNKGDYVILKGQSSSDVCVRVLHEIEAWQGAERFMGEKISMADRKVVVRRAFFRDEVLKVIQGNPLSRDELGLFESQI